MLTAVGTFAGVGLYAFSRGIKGTGFRSQPWQKVRTKTCPLFRTERMLTAVGTVLALASTHSAAESKAQGFGRSPGRRCGPKPGFLGREECGLRSEPCWRWLLRIQPRNPGQNIPVAALAEGADQNRSAFSDGKNVDCGRNRAAVGFYAFSQGIQDRRFRPQAWLRVRTKTCPFFRTGRSADCGRNRAAVGFHAVSRGIKDSSFRPQPWQ